MTDQPSSIHALDLILTKRSGGELSEAQIQFLVDSIVESDSHAAAVPRERVSQAARVSDAQLGALLMAIYQHGLRPRELAALTQAMRVSGEVFDAASLDPATRVFCVDKHSTGGVGDSTSLLIAPILAAAGLAQPTPAGVPSICVPMISGRSLGHTGGTLDKLETIPGFDTQLSLRRFAEVLRHCGAALIGQTPSLVPADRLLYAMRDHTGTVESPFLITASIMSKKLAESLHALVLDVKVGSGAFLPSLEQARELAVLMVETGTRAGTETIAVLTSMDQPLSRFAGNWIEVAECVAILQGQRHPLSHDLIELSLVLSGHMLHLAGRADSAAAGALLAERLLVDGSANRAWLALAEAQGGDLGVFQNPFAQHRPAARQVLTAPGDGFLFSMDCRQVGWAIQRLGAGRSRPGDAVSANAGIEMHARLGDFLHAGQPLVTLFAEDAELTWEPELMLRDAIRLADAPPVLQPLVRGVLTAGSFSPFPST